MAGILASLLARGEKGRVDKKKREQREGKKEKEGRKEDEKRKSKKDTMHAKKDYRKIENLKDKFS